MRTVGYLVGIGEEGIITAGAKMNPTD